MEEGAKEARLLPPDSLRSLLARLQTRHHTSVPTTLAAFLPALWPNLAGFPPERTVLSLGPLGPWVSRAVWVDVLGEVAVGERPEALLPLPLGLRCALA